MRKRRPCQQSGRHGWRNLEPKAPGDPDSQSFTHGMARRCRQQVKDILLSEGEGEDGALPIPHTDEDWDIGSCLTLSWPIGPWNTALSLS